MVFFIGKIIKNMRLISNSNGAWGLEVSGSYSVGLSDVATIDVDNILAVIMEFS